MSVTYCRLVVTSAPWTLQVSQREQTPRGQINQYTVRGTKLNTYRMACQYLGHIYKQESPTLIHWSMNKTR